MKYIRGLPDKKRFERHLDTSNCCWIWTDSKNPLRGEYGRFRYKGKSALAHRASYEIYCGEIPDGMQVLHSCDDPPCVNPGHLFVGPRLIICKIWRQKAEGKSLKGIKHPKAKLNPEKAFEIRWLSAMGQSRNEVARQFGVTKPLIRQIVHNRIWRQEAHD